MTPSRPPESATLEGAVERARRLVCEGGAVREALTLLASAAESVAGPGSAASVLLLDKDGLLRNGASPNLPADYLDAIDRLRPDANLGTCAAAAATGRVVITRSFHTDSKWAELRHLPLALGYLSAWSQPIMDDGGRVLGTFGTYFREQREPTTREREAVATLAVTAAQLIAAAEGRAQASGARTAA